MIIVDAHCDTITKIMETGETLKSNNCHIDLERIQKYDNYVQLFAAFIDPMYCQAYAMKRAIQIIDRFYSELNDNNDIMMLCCNYNDIQKAVNINKTAAILSIEGGDALQGELSSLRMFYKLGVRALGLTWNHRNEIADGVGDSITGGGLTPFGREVIKEMNSLGMIIDVSHLSEKGFWDVIELSEQPIIASHSNARKVCSHKRNLWDEQMLALRKNNGVMGINYNPPFLSDTSKSDIGDIIKHIEYITALIGCDHVGLGADFDGISRVPDGVIGVQDTYVILNELGKLNYSEGDIGKIAGGNFLRIIKTVCK